MRKALFWCLAATMSAPILVVGATGATGRHVVQQLLDQGRRVKVIVRSKERMLELVSTSTTDKLEITQASLLEMSETELVEHVRGTDSVVACLGHNLTWQGVFGHPRRLVRDSVKRITDLQQCKDDDIQPKKFIIMGTGGVPNPDGTDNKRGLLDRLLLTIFMYGLPPHADNEETAVYVHSLGRESGIEWAILRPTDLIDGEVSPFKLFDKPQGSLFGDGTSTRANVAKAMVDLIVDKTLWETYKFSMPTIYDAKVDGASTKKNS